MFSISRNRRSEQNAHPSWTSDRGSELTEFAFVLTTLAALLFGIISFARAYNVYQTITRAAREGARVAALPSSVYDGDAFVDGTTSYTKPTSPIFANYIAPALKAANLNANACPGTGATDCIADYSEQIGWLAPSGTTDNQCGVSISFDYPYPLAIPFLGQNFGTLNLRTSVQMRREDQPPPGSTTCP